MKKTRIYYIGNTHIDHTWLWNWTEGYDEVKASWRSALDRMEEFPEFVFTCSTTLQYRWVEENEPEMFEEIRRRVKEGRWQLAGGWVVQSDNNVPCGEAFCREGLYGQRYFRSRFGREARTGYCVDSFGHNAQLPQILRQQGLTGWLHFRPQAFEMRLPSGPYRWVGIDGSEVVACRPPGWYCTPGDENFAATAEAVPAYAKEYPDVLFFVGVGDHGGGPTIRDLKRLREFCEAHPEYEHRYGQLDEFFRRAARSKLPAVKGELQYAFRGCYTTNSTTKSLNRRAEGRLAMAEWAASMASMTAGAPYPAEELSGAWDRLLANQFHDVMSGTCTVDAMKEAEFRFGSVLEAADRVRHFALKRITDSFDRRAPRPFKESLAFCLCNSLSWPRTEPVEFYPHVPGRQITEHAVVDGEGRAVDFQKVRPDFGEPDKFDSILVAPELPAGGAAVFHVVQDPKPRTAKTDLKATPTSLENAFWRVRVDTKRGSLRSLLHKKGGVELIPRAKRADDLLVMRDLGDTWGTERDRFGDQIGAFERAEVRLLEKGPLRARLEVRRRYGLCTAYETISLYRGQDLVDFHLEVIWNDELKTVKIAFPLALEDVKATYEIPYGAIERPADGTENPLQRWLSVKGRAAAAGGKKVRYSVGVAVDSIGGADVKAGDGSGAEVRLTLLRSPVYGYLTNQDIKSSPDRPIVDRGTPRRVRYRLVAGRTDPGVPEHAASLGQPVQIAFEGAQGGGAVRPFSLVRCEPATVHLTALKRAEDGRGFVVRLVETRGKATQATLTGPAGYRRISTALRPFEIQSWRWKRGAAPTRCDLIEKPVKKG